MSSANLWEASFFMSCVTWRYTFFHRIIVRIVIRFGNADCLVIDVHIFPLVGNEFTYADSGVGKNKKHQVIMFQTIFPRCF